MTGTVANPEIYGKRVDKTLLPNVSEIVKEKTKELLNYQSILQDLEKNVILKQVELEKQKLRNIAYATNVNRGAKKYYMSLANSLKDKTGYSAPKNIEDKVFYDVAFRLQELGFAKNIDLSKKVEYNDTLAREIIVFQKLAQLRGQEGVVGPETLKALLKNEVTASTVLGQKTENKQIPSHEQTSSDKNTLDKNINPESNGTGTSTTNGTSLNDSATVPKNPGDSYIATINMQNVVAETKEDKTKKTPGKIKKVGIVAVSLSNTLDNITDKELRMLDKFDEDKNVNKNDRLYDEFENRIVAKIAKKYAGGKIKTFEGNIQNSVREILINYSEGYLDAGKSRKRKNSQEEKNPEKKMQEELELDPSFFFAIRDSIIDFLSDAKRPTQEKQRLILFVRSFTDNFNDILRAYELEMQKSALSLIESTKSISL